MSEELLKNLRKLMERKVSAYQEYQEYLASSKQVHLAPDPDARESENGPEAQKKANSLMPAEVSARIDALQHRLEKSYEADFDVCGRCAGVIEAAWLFEHPEQALCSACSGPVQVG